MRENRVIILFFVFLIVALSLPKYISKAKADVANVYTTGAGNFLPVENCSLILTNASVIFNIEYPGYKSPADQIMSLPYIYLNFSGNYTIYNPDDSLNTTLVAPFSPDFRNLESTCLIKIEENVTPFSFVEYNSYQSPWEEYLDVYPGMSSKRKFIVINVTIPENDSVIVKYSYNAYIANSDSTIDELRIYYDVGTSRAWNGTITERVEFKVHGRIPDSYLECDPYLSNYNCAISNIQNGKSYAWEWINERIMINSVYISYYYPHRLLTLILFILIPSMIAVTIIILVKIKRKGT